MTQYTMNTQICNSNNVHNIYPSDVGCPQLFLYLIFKNALEELISWLTNELRPTAGKYYIAGYNMA